MKHNILCTHSTILVNCEFVVGRYLIIQKQFWSKWHCVVIFSNTSISIPEVYNWFTSRKPSKETSTFICRDTRLFARSLFVKVVSGLPASPKSNTPSFCYVKHVAARSFGTIEHIVGQRLSASVCVRFEEVTDIKRSFFLLLKWQDTFLGSQV